MAMFNFFSKSRSEPMLSEEFISSEFDDINLPENIPDIPGMISQSEARYLYWLASEVYTGTGNFIEVGTWLGRSTVHICAGLKQKHPGTKLTCYDHFEWAGGANWNALIGSNHEAGSDFMQMFFDNVKDYKDVVDARKSKIRDIEIPQGPVEIIVLDAPKRTTDVSSVLTAISGQVIPNKTILAWQDFMHGPSFEIAACLYSIADYLEPIHAVEGGNLVAFRVLKDWSPKIVTVDALSFVHWSSEKAKAVHKYWSKVVTEDYQATFGIGQAMLLHDIGEIDQACKIFNEIQLDKMTELRMDRWSHTSLAKRYEALFQEYAKV